MSAAEGPLFVAAPEITSDQCAVLRDAGRTMHDFRTLSEYMHHRVGRADYPFPANVVAVLHRAPRDWSIDQILAALNSAKGTPRRHWDWFRCAIQNTGKRTLA